MTRLGLVLAAATVILLSACPQSPPEAPPEESSMPTVAYRGPWQEGAPSLESFEGGTAVLQGGPPFNSWSSGSPDGRIIAHLEATGRGSLKIWNVALGAWVAELVPPAARLEALLPRADTLFVVSDGPPALHSASFTRFSGWTHLPAPPCLGHYLYALGDAGLVLVGENCLALFEEDRWQHIPAFAPGPTLRPPTLATTPEPRPQAVSLWYMLLDGTRMLLHLTRQTGETPALQGTEEPEVRSASAPGLAAGEIPGWNCVLHPVRSSVGTGETPPEASFLPVLQAWQLKPGEGLVLVGPETLARWHLAPDSSAPEGPAVAVVDPVTLPLPLRAVSANLARGHFVGIGPADELVSGPLSGEGLHWRGPLPAFDRPETFSGPAPSPHERGMSNELVEVPWQVWPMSPLDFAATESGWPLLLRAIGDRLHFRGRIDRIVDAASWKLLPSPERRAVMWPQSLLWSQPTRQLVSVWSRGLLETETLYVTFHRIVADAEPVTLELECAVSSEAAQHSPAPPSLAQDADGRYLLISARGCVHVYSLASRKRLSRMSSPGALAAGFGADSESFYVAFSDGRLTRQELLSGTPGQTVIRYDRAIYAADFAPQLDQVLIVSPNPVVADWDDAAPMPLTELIGHPARGGGIGPRSSSGPRSSPALTTATPRHPGDPSRILGSPPADFALLEVLTLERQQRLASRTVRWIPRKIWLGPGGGEVYWHIRGESLARWKPRQQKAALTEISARTLGTLADGAFVAGSEVGLLPSSSGRITSSSRPPFSMRAIVAVEQGRCWAGFNSLGELVWGTRSGDILGRFIASSPEIWAMTGPRGEAGASQDSSLVRRVKDGRLAALEDAQRVPLPGLLASVGERCKAP